MTSRVLVCPTMTPEGGDVFAVCRYRLGPDRTLVAVELLEGPYDDEEYAQMRADKLAGRTKNKQSGI